MLGKKGEKCWIRDKEEGKDSLKKTEIKIKIKKAPKPTEGRKG